MQFRRMISILQIAVLLLSTNACGSPVFSWLTKSSAPWWYVNDYWGGLSLNHHEEIDGKTILTFNLKIHEIKFKPDGFHIYGADFKVREDRILITLYRWMEPGGIPPKLTLSIRNLRPGKYKLVYDDKLANYPSLGLVEIK